MSSSPTTALALAAPHTSLRLGHVRPFPSEHRPSPVASPGPNAARQSAASDVDTISDFGTVVM